MKIEQLKNFLRLRGLKVTGKKKEILVATAFCATENIVTLVKTAQLKEEHSMELELENCILPDPFKLQTGSIKEEDGITY